MLSFKAQEKSTISTDMALVISRVNRYVRPVAPRHQGTRLSASLAALFSDSDVSFSESSIIFTMES